MNATLSANSDLLALAAGCTKCQADKLLADHKGSLFALFHGHQPRDLFAGESAATYHMPQPMQRLQAARELLCRAMVEDLAEREAFTSPNVVRDYLRLRLRGLGYEVFYVLFLDAQNRLIDAVEMFKGTLTQTSVYPREVVKAALAHNAATVMFAHNHPSGVAEPSWADEVLTRQLKEALALVDVRVLDHFIVAGSRVLSFAESGLL